MTESKILKMYLCGDLLRFVKESINKGDTRPLEDNSKVIANLLVKSFTIKSNINSVTVLSDDGRVNIGIRGVRIKTPKLFQALIKAMNQR